jgi:hypothetical protein
LKQAVTRADGPHRRVGLLPKIVAADHPLVLLVGAPVNISLVMISKEDLDLGKRHDPSLSPPGFEGTRINGITGDQETTRWF